MQSSPLPSSPPFMSGVYSSIFQSTLPRPSPSGVASKEKDFGFLGHGLLLSNLNR
ncbi:hypothetical protein [Treponema endosymbiont of Eucomonympha sp.]|uniref:hypothetical protein n=1 Tax=Treponema endosymbiont of Eucomonympha sp. TaxID=1580831 RepID=UPI00165019B2|nr:hypothetical protein [Treponema endosymbiont of Eucomonympha sp.]